MSFDEAVIVLAWVIATVVVIGIGLYSVVRRACRWFVELKDTLLNGAAIDIK